MNGNPMEEQIGRLVGNLLAGVGEVYLPGVGSLYTERIGAKRLSRRTVLPPCRTVAFTSQQQGVSLVDEIARVLLESGEYEDPEAEAQAVYERWIERVYQVNLLTIEGVGELKFKNFILDEAFDRRLNPQGHEPVRIRVQRRFDWPLWVGVAAILVAVVYGGREFLLLYPDEAETTVVAETPAVPDSLPAVETPDALAEVPAAELPKADGAGLPANVAPETTPKIAPNTTPEKASEQEYKVSETPMSLLPGRHYVVLGVFSTPENAVRAAQQAVAKDPVFRCRIYYFGEKYMVSPFSSDEAPMCADFIRNQSDNFPDMWTYTAR